MSTEAGVTTAHEYEWWFSNHNHQQGLKERSVKGGLNTLFGQVISFSSNFLSTMVLARLLTPADFGLVAMVTSVTGFVLMFKDMGLSAAIIQREKLVQWQVSAIFWMNVLFSMSLALLVGLLAPALASFYHEPKLLPITLSYAITVLVAGLSQQHNALLSRKMEFAKLARVNVLAVIGSITVAIAAAYWGLGYWSIVVQNISLTCFTTIGMWLSCNWRPEFRPHVRGVKEFLHFGAGISGFNMINYFSRNVDNVLIGKMVSTAALGLYSKAYQLLLLPITQLRDPLNTVAIPAMSALQNDPDKFQSYYRRYLFIMAFCSMPIVALMAVCAAPIINIVLGKGWEQAAVIFQYLAFTAFIQPVLSTAGLTLISTGQSRRYFILGLVNSTFVVIGFLVGIRWGITGITVAYALVHYITLVPLLWYSFRGTAITLTAFAAETIPAAASCILAAVATFFLLPFFPINDVIRLMAGGLVFSVVYLIVWLLIPGGKTKLLQLKNIFSELMAKKTRAK